MRQIKPGESVQLNVSLQMPQERSHSQGVFSMLKLFLKISFQEPVSESCLEQSTAWDEVMIVRDAQPWTPRGVLKPEEAIGNRTCFAEPKLSHRPFSSSLDSGWRRPLIASSC